MTRPFFHDRSEAGQRLAGLVQLALSGIAPSEVVVVALPRGGLPVATEVADALRAPLDVLQVRKIGAPDQPEYAIGALTEEGIASVNETSARATGADEQYIAATMSRLDREIAGADDAMRRILPATAMERRAIVVVDDGVATGMTATVACWALRARGAWRVILAAPVVARAAMPALRRQFDDVVCIETEIPSGAVSGCYEHFEQVSDDEVLAIVSRHRVAAAARGVSAARPGA